MTGLFYSLWALFVAAPGWTLAHWPVVAGAAAVAAGLAAHIWVQRRRAEISRRQTEFRRR